MELDPSLQSESERNAFLTLFDEPLRRELLAFARIASHEANMRLFREGDPLIVSISCCAG